LSLYKSDDELNDLMDGDPNEKYHDPDLVKSISALTLDL